MAFWRWFSGEKLHCTIAEARQRVSWYEERIWRAAFANRFEEKTKEDWLFAYLTKTVREAAAWSNTKPKPVKDYLLSFKIEKPFWEMTKEEQAEKFKHSADLWILGMTGVNPAEKRKD